MSAPSTLRRGTPFEVAAAFLPLGLTSFGGPVAHLGYFHAAFVDRRKWLTATDYADIVALCQFLPGPASSQVGFAIGYLRAGLAGALAAFITFTAPSVLLLIAAAWGASLWQGPLAHSLIHGLKIAAVAVIIQALVQMAGRLASTATLRLIALAAAATVLASPWPATQVAVIAIAAIGGAALGTGSPSVAPSSHLGVALSRRAGLAILAIWLALLVALPLLAPLDSALALVDRFYRTGSLVFGGGHVVLPLLQTELVTPGLIDRDLFLAGYGAAQAVPGPLFSFAFYAGMLLRTAPNGLLGGSLALLAIYLPAFLLVLGALPFWQVLRGNPRLRRGLGWANAAVVGLLLAALAPALPAAIGDGWDAALLAAALIALGLNLPPWAVVIGSGALAALLHLG